jgi:hypothetical protein
MKMILSLLEREPYVTNSGLLCIIWKGLCFIAEHMIRRQPERGIDFDMASCEFEFSSWDTMKELDTVTPLVMACSCPPSAAKLSLVRCLLERNAKADLRAMTVAAQRHDKEVITLLHQHGAPVNGFIPNFGTPLSSTCQTFAQLYRFRYQIDKGLACIRLLLSLGASPNGPENLEKCKFSPAHALASSDTELPLVVEPLDLLIDYGAHIDRCAVHSTALEHAIEESQWNFGMKLLSAGCELTGRELQLINHRVALRVAAPAIDSHKYQSAQFINMLLERQPWQAENLLRRDWSPAVEEALLLEDEDAILALLAIGVRPAPSDF